MTPARQVEVSPSLHGATVAQAYPRVQHFVAPSPVTMHASLAARSPSISLSEPSPWHRESLVQPATAAASDDFAATRVVQLAVMGSPSMHSSVPLQRTGGASDLSYEVEAILDSRVQHGRAEYLIRWAGFASQQCTWEPEKSLLPGAEKLLHAFKRQHNGGRDAEPPQVQRRKPARGKKRKGRTGAAAFLDLEANLSGSDASSDEDEDDDGDGQAPSWVVGDEVHLSICV